MRALLIVAVPLAIASAGHAVGAPLGWGGNPAAAMGANAERPLLLVQNQVVLPRRGSGRAGGGRPAGVRANHPNSRAYANRANVNRQNFNSNNFRRDVTVNRNVTINGGCCGRNYGPNWGGVAAAAAVGAGVAVAATAAANSTAYPPPPPYPYGYYYQPPY